MRRATMRIFLLSPELTVGGGGAAAEFHRALAEALSGFLEVVPAADRFALAAAEPRKADAAVLYNRADGTYAPEVTAFLDELVAAGGQAYPVALGDDALRPPPPIPRAQSFDVPARLRQRGLPAASAVALAPVFAREIVARQRPTLAEGRVSLFVSYRRADGEPVAAAMAEQLRVRAQAEAFRDRVDVRAGEDAQQVIIERLSASDAVVFVDTPRAGSSEWVLTELRTALGLQLPVLWVRFGPDEGRDWLAVQPSGRPHLEFPEVPLDASSIPAGIADQVLEAAWEGSREAASRTFTQIRRLRTLARSRRIGFSEVDPGKLIYSVAIPREPFRFPQRPVRHLVQFYAHRPRREHREAFDAELASLGCVPPHQVFGSPHDAAVLLAPIPPQDEAVAAGGGPEFAEAPAGVFVDSVEEYVSAVADHVERAPRQRGTRNAVIVSGAFPDNATPEHQQHLAEALHALVRVALDRGARIIFGNHPTFRPLILELARRRRPNDARAAVRVYTSALFPVAPPAADPEIPGGVDTVVVPAEPAAPGGPGDRNPSLTAMRRAMVNDPAAAALVAIGGKGPRPGIRPGVDEEVELALQARLPVFLVGGAGGRTAELADARRAQGWMPPINPLTREQNQELATSQDFDELALLILTSLGL